MNNKKSIKVFFPLLLVFFTVNLFLVIKRALAFEWNINTVVVLSGNLVLFIATSVSYLMYYRALRNNSVQSSLRMIYGGMFLKMMICLFTAFIYILVARKGVNKGGIIVCMFLYLVYSSIEIILLLKQSRQKKNG